MSVDEALKYIISMGVVSPPARRNAERRRRPTPIEAGLNAWSGIQS